MTAVRTRVAPSPTGDVHVGTAYMALFSRVWAKKNGGRFILRIEDTDRMRSTEQSEKKIKEALEWLGLTWDEGPGVGGPYGPYRQSERLDIYREHAEALLSKGAAYRCFCTKERLDSMRDARRSGAGSGYDRLCRDIPTSESDRRAAAGEPFVIRMKSPLEGECVFTDLLRGEIRKAWSTVDDQVLIKGDGFPTYHLAVVVDDHLMKISHIIRGEEWINSVPKHVHLFSLFGWEPPVFCHMPLLRNPDRSKLSKRKNPTSITYYRNAGYLPEALLNYLGMMGWSMPGGEEKFSVDDMMREFRLEDVTLGGPVFDLAKLRWLNARYIREDYTPETLFPLLEKWRLNRDYLMDVTRVAHTRLETLADWGPLTSFFFADSVPLDAEALILKGKTSEETQKILQFAVWELERQGELTTEDVETMFKSLSEKTGIKLRDLTRPFYVAISGSKASTPLYDSLALLGSDMVRMRLRRAVDALGQVTQAMLADWEKQYRESFSEPAPEEDIQEGS
ncbi:MAG TPA: glutamate--tRNA ligase [Candidatus Fermentibacter daniensis]|nr:glutamate--tRNA ligase [Candidatus Fermentibacter daniensis]HPN63417.1 glutamate--tRNA ligase [Candidatus Fermentibacter daniensis]HQM41987.1 glutamate--tRNA ligase [Candidatus Fermentibacter daniensis]